MTRVDWYARCAMWGERVEVVARISRDEWVCEVAEKVYPSDDPWMSVARITEQLEASGLMVSKCK